MGEEYFSQLFGNYGYLYEVLTKPEPDNGFTAKELQEIAEAFTKAAVTANVVPKLPTAPPTIPEPEYVSFEPPTRNILRRA